MDDKKIECEEHGRKYGKELSLRCKKQKDRVPVFLCKYCKKIYVNKYDDIGNIRGLNYEGKYYPVIKILGPERIQKEDKTDTKNINASVKDTKNLLSESEINELNMSVGMELKIRTYSIIRELLDRTKNWNAKWRIRNVNSDDPDNEYVIYEMIGKEYITLSSSKNADAYSLCGESCTCMQDCTLLEKYIYKMLKDSQRQKLPGRMSTIEKAHNREMTLYDEPIPQPKKYQMVLDDRYKLHHSASGDTHKKEAEKKVEPPIVPVKQEHIEEQAIGLKDFVVRRNTFKCLHNDHKIKNIEATVKILMKKDARVINKKIAAGYCPKCQIFFIMESTFEKLKVYGIPLCRVSDEKNYISSKSGSMLLAKESILMQYGYNVGQNESLSSSTRQRVLAALIDTNLLSKSDVISYLDFFINQRKGQNKYEIAISKWEEDKDFVLGYRQGEFMQYGVNAIYR